MIFDTVLMVDWSGGNDRGPTPKKDSIWVCAARDGLASEPIYLRNRKMAEAWITEFLSKEQTDGRRVIAGFDFAFGYPAGFGKTLTGSDDPFDIWEWFERKVEDRPDGNNRFDLAGEINTLFPGIGPFWGNGLKRDVPNLPRKGLDRHGHGLPEKRMAEERAKGAFPVWQLAGAGAVGSQVIMGLPMLARLRRHFRDELRVWPFEPLDRPIALVEIWPSLISDAIAATQPTGGIKDAHQVLVLAQTLSAMPTSELANLLNVPVTYEGSIMGLEQPNRLAAAALGSLAPPPLRNDCFAMPQGAYWTPVQEALDHLKAHLKPVVGRETIPIRDAADRFVAHTLRARRSHPPAPNAAVDGYGFAGPAPEGLNTLMVVDGRSAAGQPFEHKVPARHAIRILTGANLPDGVDTVVLQEDVKTAASSVSFHGPLKVGANARKAGEDMLEGDVIASCGDRLTPADLGTLTAAGVETAAVHKRLRVGVLSTGDELREAAEHAGPGDIFDANRPMLCSVLEKWGYDVVDLGRAPDSRETLSNILDQGATRCDAVLTSGGASAGDEDHMSALLKDTGSFSLWRIAIKPGRPLAFGLWKNTPIFGLPGNPVAAMVCTLIFARPALRLLAGGKWVEPQGFMTPANFTKKKKTGRREYQRARIEEDKVVVFPSEGSGRVSGLSWAEGLVELDNPAQDIRPGDMVRYIPFGSFDL